MFSNSNQTNRNFETLMVSLSIFLKSKNKDFKMGRSKSTFSYFDHWKIYNSACSKFNCSKFNCSKFELIKIGIDLKIFTELVALLQCD